MLINDIWYEIFLHLDVDLMTCKLVCKTFKHIYDTYKSTLCHYGNYRFNSFQLQFINDLNNYDHDNSLNIRTMGNRGLRLAILAFALNYKEKVNIITITRDLYKWQNEVVQLTTVTDDLVYVENYNTNYKNYKVSITTSSLLNNMIIIHKCNTVPKYLKNTVYCDYFSYQSRYNLPDITYHNSYTYNNYNFYDSRNYKTIIDHIHNNQNGPFLIIGLKVEHQTYGGSKN